MSAAEQECSGSKAPGIAEGQGEPAKHEEHAHCQSGGSFVETTARTATVILVILGLAGIQNPYMLAILTILVGVALLNEGCSLMVRCARLLCQVEEACCHPPQLVSRLSSELLAGAMGVVLGLLALLGVGANILVPVAIIVFGTSLAWSNCLRAKLCRVECAVNVKGEVFRQAAREAALAAVGAQVLIGLAAVILGILGVLGNNTILLSMVALLVLGFSILLNGIATSGRMLSLLGRY